jgi:hypothetical protein
MATAKRVKSVAKVSIELALQDELLSQDVSKEVTERPTNCH